MDKMAQPLQRSPLETVILFRHPRPPPYSTPDLRVMPSLKAPAFYSILASTYLARSMLAAKTREAYYSLIKPIAKKYSLLLDGASLSDASSIGNITVEPSLGHEPSPISPFTLDSEGWLIFSRACKRLLVLKYKILLESVRFYPLKRFEMGISKQVDRSENIYRWSPTRAGTKLNIHTVDEKIKIQTHVEGIKFYTG
ncbi:hypothetical protein BDZ97DRAFT_1770415 [Flammula alnicola]|nr:hypothetical protein BDZ97DRAFT_1770415 [Flammula alnicola]